MSDLLKAMSNTIRDAETKTGGAARTSDWNYSRRVHASGSATVDLTLKGEGHAEQAFTDSVALATYASARKIKGKDKDSGENASNTVDFKFALSQLPGEFVGETAYDTHKRRLTEESAVETGESAEADKLARELEV